MRSKIRIAASLVFAVTACSHATPPLTADDTAPDATGALPASAATRAANAAFEKLPLADPTDLADAQRGRIAHEDDLVIGEKGRIWDTTTFRFLTGDAPATVNPSLWRQAKLNDLHGLFEVTQGVYQVRG